MGRLLWGLRYLSPDGFFMGGDILLRQRRTCSSTGTCNYSARSHRRLHFSLRRLSPSQALSLGRYLVMQFTYRTDGVGAKPHMLPVRAERKRP